MNQINGTFLGIECTEEVSLIKYNYEQHYPTKNEFKRIKANYIQFEQISSFIKVLKCKLINLWVKLFVIIRTYVLNSFV